MEIKRSAGNGSEQSSALADVFFDIEPEGDGKIKNDGRAKSHKTAVYKIHPYPRFVKAPFFSQIVTHTKTVFLYNGFDVVFDD